MRPQQSNQQCRFRESDKMKDQNSVESNLDNTESDLQNPTFDFEDSDCESVQSRSPSWKKSSGGQCDASIESPWYLLEDVGYHSSSNDVSDEEQEENSHEISRTNDLVPKERRLTCATASNSNVQMVDKRGQNRGVISFATTSKMLRETDSFPFCRVSPRKRDENRSINKDQRSRYKTSPQQMLNRHCGVKGQIPQFAVIEWDEEMLRRQVIDYADSSSDEG